MSLVNENERSPATGPHPSAATAELLRYLDSRHKSRLAGCGPGCPEFAFCSGEGRGASSCRAPVHMKTSTIRTGLLAAALLTIAPAIPSAGQAPTQERAFDPRGSLRAALGTATLECLGTVGPSLYETQSGHLWRTFRTCTTGDDLALTRIDAILRAQLSSEGSRDGLAEFMVTG